MIDLEKLDFEFISKPLLIGGKAMEHYGLRKAGADIDFVINEQDYERLAQKYPDHLRDLGGDLGVCVFEFEIWKSICLFDYQFLSAGAIEQDAYLIISLDRLLFLKALGMKEPKYHRDLELVVGEVLQVRYKEYQKENQERR
jgi:hypothetical protein